MPRNGNDLRTIEIEGTPWFVAADVCRCIGLEIGAGSSGATNYLKPLGADERQLLRRGVVNGSPLFANTQAPSLTIVSESGHYKLIMRSDKATARPCQGWMTLRKAGLVNKP